VAEYFDVGQSRSLPWKRRPRAARLLADLADPHRGFDAVVIGGAAAGVLRQLKILNGGGYEICYRLRRAEGHRRDGQDCGRDVPLLHHDRPVL
jgi:hypothetical protein